MTKFNTLPELQFSELQTRLKGRVSMDRLLTFLSRCGEVCSTVLQCDVIVMKFVDYAGRTVRAYGKSFRDALCSLSYQYWC